MSGRELFEAARDGDLTRVQELLEIDGTELNYLGEVYTPLTIALFNQHEKIALALIKAGADVNLQNNNGQSPLYIAVFHSINLAVITALLENGVKANFRRHRGFTVLEHALAMGRCKVSKLILDHDKSIMGRDLDRALVLAAHWGYLDTVKELTARDADLDYRAKFNHPALIGAFEKKHYDVVLYLIGAGADLNCETADKIAFSTLVAGMEDLKDKENIVAAIELRRKQERSLPLLRMLTTFGVTNVEKEKCPDKAPVKSPMPMLAAAGAGAGSGAEAANLEEGDLDVRA